MSEDKKYEYISINKMISSGRIARLVALNSAAPIMSLPADIRAIVYRELAPIDQFKVDCFDEFAVVFNPYFDRLVLSDPIVMELYQDMGVSMHEDTCIPQYAACIINLRDMYRSLQTPCIFDEYCVASCCNGSIKLNVFTAIVYSDTSQGSASFIHRQEYVIAIERCLSYIISFYRADTNSCLTTDKYLFHISITLFYRLVNIVGDARYAKYRMWYLRIFIKYFGSNDMYTSLLQQKGNVINGYMKDINVILNSSAIVSLLIDGYAKQMYNKLGVRVLLDIFSKQILPNKYE